MSGAVALATGFGVAGAVAVLRGVPAVLVLVLFGFVLLLAQAFVGLGLLFAVVTSSRARATTLALVAWLVLVALGTLGVLIAFVRWGLPPGVLTIWSLVNPVEAFRLGIIAVLDPDVSVLGPMGARLVERLTAPGVTLLTAASLFVWAVVLALIGLRVFHRRA